MNAGRMVAKFDSATAMLRALAGFLHGRDFPIVGGRAQAEPLAAGSVPCWPVFNTEPSLAAINRYPMPPPLPLEDLDALLDRQGARYAVDWK